MAMRWLAILAVLLGLLFAGAARAVDDVVSTLTDRYADASLLILGEYHGTEESPAVLLGLTRHWLRDGPVTIALELWRSEQERIDTYLASPGTEADRQTLLRGAFWQREPRDSDGRRSEATLQLIEDLRRLTAQGLPLGVVAIDDRPVAGDEADAHRVLADAIRRLRGERPRDRLLVLVGNYHARLVAPRAVRDQDGQPLSAPTPTAAYLRDLDPICVLITAQHGSFWHHGQTHPLNVAADRGPGVLNTNPEHEGVHAIAILPRLSPSPPVQVARQE